ncbi:MAG: hypothetical protein ACYC61_14345 [Isosphaeraceae bacterium]
MRPRDSRCRPAIVAIGLLALSQAARAEEPAKPNVEKAARYLDDRAAEWFGFDGADRGEGADKVSCLSCHTTVSYALGRPAARRLSGQKKPTDDETQILANVRRRVEHWSELDSPRFRLSYDFDDRKKVESWGTEAVLNLLVLADHDRRSKRKTPGETTRKALAILWNTQQKQGPDAGSWDWLNFNLRPWEAGEARFYGATLAAIALGTLPGGPAATDDPASREGVERLRTYLSSHVEKQNLHNRLVALWAATELKDVLTASQRREVIDAVMAKQRDDGGWSLSSLVDCRRQDGTPQEAASDGYATGLALHVLQRAGLGRDEPAIAKGLQWLRTHQQPEGNWVGYSLNKKRDPETHVGRFMSDAATAMALLALEPH